MHKRRQPDQPAFFLGKIVFDFFNNDDEEFKQRSLKSLTKEVRKEFNISCISVDDYEVENPERGSVVFSFCATHRAIGKEVLERVLAFFDEKAPARILSQETKEVD